MGPYPRRCGEQFQVRDEEIAIGDHPLSNMTQVLTGLITNGEFTQILDRLDD
ncbi:hypothetical protein OHB00_06710 [Streptomyces sp. NBC_00631]|uniref:hypothetical protein n=1 Tax=Streptomyces sp. NBC_00631 TaxID=2975793 RepID=UPI0030E519EB